jgi:hypothetical protein
VLIAADDAAVASGRSQRFAIQLVLERIHLVFDDVGNGADRVVRTTASARQRHAQIAQLYWRKT